MVDSTTKKVRWATFISLRTLWFLHTHKQVEQKFLFLNLGRFGSIPNGVDPYFSHSKGASVPKPYFDENQVNVIMKLLIFDQV